MAAQHRIIPRSEWGARFGTGWGTRPLPATEAWLHRPAMYGSPGVGSTFDQDAAHVRRIEDVGRARFRDADFKDGREVWPLPLGSGISYTYVISRSGRIFAGHDPARQASHTKGHNDVGVGIALADGPSEDTPATAAQIQACVWLLRELVRLGVLTSARLNGGHRDTGFATSCPTAAHEAIPTINALTGADMARRAPTRADVRALEVELRNRGFEIYCGPSYVDRGYCAPGKHPHSATSAHFESLAVDFGWPGAPINDLEALHVELLMEELARHPEIAWRRVWNYAPGDHDDHGHVDNRLGWSGWNDVVKPRPGVRARDGVDLFVSPQAFPYHVPPGNHGYRLSHMVTAQTLLGRMTDPATGLPLLRGRVDGYWGPLTESATKAAQRILRLSPVDGIPGPVTLAAIRDHLAKPVVVGPPKVEPPVVQPPPEPPAPVDPPGRLAGGDRYSTAAQVALAAPTERRAKVYLVAGNAPTLADGLAAAAAGDGVVLYVRAGQDALPSPTLAALRQLQPAEVIPVGSPSLVTIPAVLAARAAAGII